MPPRAFFENSERLLWPLWRRHEFILKSKSGGETVRKRQRYFELWSKDASGGWTISFFINNLDVREELNGSVSHWFLSEEVGSRSSVVAEKS